MIDFQFQNPYILLLILPFIFCSLKCKAKEDSIYFSNIKILKKTKSPVELETFLKYLAIFLLLLAIASPVTTKDYKTFNSLSLPFILCIDASESMQYDFNDDTVADSKFKISKQIALNFINKRENDQIALLFFGDYTYIASPLTSDKSLLKEILSLTKVNIAGITNTVIYDAIYLSSLQLKNIKADNKTIILITDGEDRRSSIEFKALASEIITNNITLFTIVIGDNQNNSLKKLTIDSGGKFFNASSKDDIKIVFQTIDKLKKTVLKSNRYSLVKYYYQLPLFLSFFIFLGYLYLQNRRIYL